MPDACDRRCCCSSHAATARITHTRNACPVSSYVAGKRLEQTLAGHPRIAPSPFAPVGPPHLAKPGHRRSEQHACVSATHGLTLNLLFRLPGQEEEAGGALGRQDGSGWASATSGKPQLVRCGHRTDLRVRRMCRCCCHTAFLSYLRLT